MHKYIFTQNFAHNFRSPLRINWIEMINLTSAHLKPSICHHALSKISFYSFVSFYSFALMMFYKYNKGSFKDSSTLFFQASFNVEK